MSTVWRLKKKQVRSAANANPIVRIQPIRQQGLGNAQGLTGVVRKKPLWGKQLTSVDCI